MEFFRIRRDIPFMRHALVFNVISLLTFVAAVIFLAVRGLNFSIEFTGGVNVETTYQQPADVEAIRAALVKAGVTEPQVQNFGTARDVLLRLSLKDVATSTAISTPDHKLDQGKLTDVVLKAGGADAKVTRV